jgi:hypothetical protein
MRATSAALIGVGGTVVGAFIVLKRAERVPPDLRREMLESAESFVAAEIAAADLVSEAIGARKHDEASAIEAFDRAEQAILALERKIIRLGLVFGQYSFVHKRAIECSSNLHMFLMRIRDTPPERGLGLGFVRGADALHSLQEAASAEIRGTSLPLRIRRGWL